MKTNTSKFKHQYAMIIDDEELDNFLNEKLLAYSHFSKHIYKHSNAISALTFLSDLKGKGKEGMDVFPEIIFIDLNMPVVDGFQFIESFNELVNLSEAKSKLVVLTSSVSQKDREKVADLGKRYLFATKPLSTEYLKYLDL